ncbi:uncharacterized protein LOC111400722 [Olea europaea var. sylvestris]|uniref:uncharacterized protein LOC111400722 n=1 Tax=Olea europaea var. sylvestris TaxID=158386 RepID=UPI000C1D5B65|nr:uncharacterized protein LOC111400722 [Olea europaea var. sylvestris]
MSRWIEMEIRFQKKQTIDKSMQEQINKDIEHWKQFDLVMQEHIRQIQNKEIHYHYLGHKIQNELILMLAGEIKKIIIEKLKESKYFSVILDCTPDLSHEEQISIILRCVDISASPAKLDIDNIRRQGYDNGANMKGKHKGATCCTKAKSFFGVVQRIYTLFSSSTKRCKFFKDNVNDLTLKPLSQTRWESHVESIRAIRSQAPQIRNTLLELARVDDPKTKSEVECLATYEIENFEFLLEMVICYRETGFESAVIDAKKIASELDIGLIFREKKVIHRKKQFDEISCEEMTEIVEESFRANYFLYVVDQALSLLQNRFKQFQEYDNILGFLFDLEKLKSIDDATFKPCCINLEN